MRPGKRIGGRKHDGRGFRAGRTRNTTPHTAELRPDGAVADARAGDQEVHGSHVRGSGSCGVEDQAGSELRRNVVGRGALRSSTVGREDASQTCGAECTSDTSTPVRSRSRGMRGRRRSSLSTEGHEISGVPRGSAGRGNPPERNKLVATMAEKSHGLTREWKIIRRRSRQSRFSRPIRPTSSAKSHGGGGSRSEVSRSRGSNPERIRRERSTRREKGVKRRKRLDSSSDADTSSARSRGGGCPAEARDRDPNARRSKIIAQKEARSSTNRFQCDKAKKIASRRSKGHTENHGRPRHDSWPKEKSANESGLGEKFMPDADKNAGGNTSAAGAAPAQASQTLRTA